MKEYPSYWIGTRCVTCNAHIGKLIRWLKREMKFVVRMVQPTCRCAVANEYRKVDEKDEDEYLKRYGLEEPSQ